AIGKRLRLGDAEQWIEVVGVAGDVGLPARMETPETRLQLYRPLLQRPTRYVVIALRTTRPPATLTQEVRQAVAAFDPDLPVAHPVELRAEFNRALSNLNLVIVNLSISAGMGLM